MSCGAAAEQGGAAAKQRIEDVFTTVARQDLSAALTEAAPDHGVADDNVPLPYQGVQPAEQAAAPSPAAPSILPPVVTLAAPPPPDQPPPTVAADVAPAGAEVQNPAPAVQASEPPAAASAVEQDGGPRMPVPAPVVRPAAPVADPESDLTVARLPRPRPSDAGAGGHPASQVAAAAQDAPTAHPGGPAKPSAIAAAVAAAPAATNPRTAPPSPTTADFQAASAALKAALSQPAILPGGESPRVDNVVIRCLTPAASPDQPAKSVGVCITDGGVRDRRQPSAEAERTTSPAVAALP